MSFFEAALLPDASKRALCEGLLTEFGARIKSVNERTGEMVHGCLVSPGVHRDQERNPTASLNYQKLVYSCLGCGASGGLLWFIAVCRDETSVEARRWLEKTAGLGGQVMELGQMLKVLDSIYSRPERAPVPSFSERLLEPWAYEHPYFTEERHISPETSRTYRLGWDPSTDRVVLPHFWNERLVGWQSRKLPPEWRAMPWEPKPPRADGEEVFDIHSGAPDSPKYHSSPDFPKDSTVYNHREGGQVVVVEAMLSVLRHEHAYHSEATFGAKVTPTQLRRLARHDEVILWMDPDRAGWDAMMGHPEVKPTRKDPKGKEAVPGMAEILSAHTRVRIVASPWQQDPADIPTEDAVELKDAAVPWSVWKPPKVLYCFQCKNRAHKGPCSS